MRDNFRPNVRLATNILMVFGTFLIAINLASIGKQDKKSEQRRDDCADVFARVITVDEFVKKYKIAITDKNLLESKNNTQRAVSVFCQFYKNGSYVGT